MRITGASLILFLLPGLALQAAAQEADLFNPYERPRNGPPLTNVFRKVELNWLFKKLQDPRHHVSARMPQFALTDDEVWDVMAYLESIATPAPVAPVWPSWSGKTEDEMTDEEWDAMFEVQELGKVVWRQARCTICHSVTGPAGRIGGFVDLRVGGIDLDMAGTKLRRDWLYAWIQEPKAYFLNTLMPRYRLSGEDVKALVEYILRDDSFRTGTAPEPEPETVETWAALDHPTRVAAGKKLIETTRCVVCHVISGIEELLELPNREPVPSEGTFEYLAYDLRCLTCHSIEGRGGSYAPDLTTVGSRLHEEWIAGFLAAPDMVRPLSQQMPKFGLTSEEARVAASYLAEQRRDSTVPEALPTELLSTEWIERGRETFDVLGCVACHSIGEGAGGLVGPDLTALGERMRTGYMRHHLKHPHSVNNYSQEPDFGLSNEDADALAAYLATKHR